MQQLNKSSLFAQPFMLLLLLAGAFGAVWLGARAAALFLLILFLLEGISWLWSRGALRRAALSIPEEQPSCHAGEWLRLTLCLHNRSFFPVIWLEAVLPMGKKALLSRNADEPGEVCEIETLGPRAVFRERFVWLLWQQELRCEEALYAAKRGVVPLERVLLSAGDGFGLAACRRWAKLEAPRTLVIYPALLPVDLTIFERLISEAQAGKRGQTEDPTLLRSVRDYQPGDPARKLNWRALAMSGRMQINQYEQYTPGCMLFVLDLQSYRLIQETDSSDGRTIRRITVREAALERMISLIASLLTGLSARGMRFALLLPGYGGREALRAEPGCGDAALARVLYALAEIDYAGESAAFDPEVILHESHSGRLFFCAFSEAETTLAMHAAELGRGRVRFIVSTSAETPGEAGVLTADSLLSGGDPS